MPKKLKLLVSAYACSPNCGSEPGMGWNFVLGLCKYHEVHVITEKLKWEEPVKAFLQENPDLESRLKFYFLKKKRNKKLRKLWPPSYYWFYKDWQKKAYQLALVLERKENFDLIHQLNMVGYREPGYLWKIKKPFVWGPIGGLENSPWRFLPSLGLKGLTFYAGRNIFNLFQRNLSTRTKQASQRSGATLIAATPGNQKMIRDLWSIQSRVICEVGQEKNKDKISLSQRTSSKDPLRIIWSGLHTPGKNLPLLLNSLEKVNFPFELHILGKGEMTNKWKKLVKKKGINNCHWYGWVKREKAIEIMRTGHVFCITSISDLTSTVTLEALSFGLPIICLDHCGFAHVVTEKCGIKIPVTTPNLAVKNFAAALCFIAMNENHRLDLSKGALERAQTFSWDKKIEDLNFIYYKAIS